MKIRPQGAELFNADGQTGHTDMKKLTVAFRNFANVPKNPASCPQFYFCNFCGQPISNSNRLFS